MRARRHSSGRRSAHSKSALARLALAGTALVLLQYCTTVTAAWPPRALSAAMLRKGSGSNTQVPMGVRGYCSTDGVRGGSPQVVPEFEKDDPEAIDKPKMAEVRNIACIYSI